MKLFCSSSIFAYRPLRRWRYKGGHGVHSTYTFRFIREVMSPPYPYYADSELSTRYAEQSQGRSPETMDLHIGLLWMRIVARTTPSVAYYALEHETIDAQLYGRTADSRIQHSTLRGEILTSHETSERPPILLCDDVDDAQYFLDQCPPSSEPIVLILHIRKDKAHYTQWRDWVDSLERGIILDAYDCCVFIRRNHHLYTYRAAY